MNWLRLLRGGAKVSGHLLLRAAALPLRVAVRRDARRWVVIGFGDGRFADNTKHFFCWVVSHAPHAAVFICRSDEQSAEIRAHGASALTASSIRGRLTLLRAGVVIVDCWTAFQAGLYPYFRRAKVVQLWHGAPIKEIELAMHRRRLSRLGGAKARLAAVDAVATQRFPHFNLLLSTSKFLTRTVFLPSFSASTIFESAYPRDDCLVGKRPLSGLPTVNVDLGVLARCASHRAAGGRVVLYVPTFRDDGRCPLGPAEVAAWSDVALTGNALVLFKLHPNASSAISIPTKSRLVQIAPTSDVYPILSSVDLLVTDYSSIYFDFLLLDRPIVFFPFDLDAYISGSRHLTFDYDEMTPGPKVTTTRALVSAITHELDHPDGRWRDARHRVRDLVFDQPPGSASQRVWDVVCRDNAVHGLECPTHNLDKSL